MACAEAKALVLVAVAIALEAPDPPGVQVLSVTRYVTRKHERSNLQEGCLNAFWGS